MLSSISQLKEKELQRRIKVIPIGLIKQNRKVIPLVEPSLQNLPVGLAMILDLSQAYMKLGLMNRFFKRSDFAPEVVISYKYNNPLISTNPYELAQYVRISFAAYARQNRKNNFLFEFPIFKVLNNQLRPRSQWIKYVDKSLLTQDVIDRVNNISSTGEIDDIGYGYRESFDSERIYLGKNYYFEDAPIDVSVLFEGAIWVSKSNPSVQVRIEKIDKNNRKLKYVRIRGDKVISKPVIISIEDFIANFRYKLREGVKRKDVNVMLTQTKNYINMMFADCLRRTYDEYLSRYAIQLASVEELFSLIELDNTSLRNYTDVGHFGAMLAKNFVDKAFSKK